MATNNATNTSNPVTVGQGGTGASSLTSHSVLVGNGTGVVTQIAVGGARSILIGNAGANPSFSTTGTPQVNSISFDAGANSLGAYIQGTFTPTLTNTGSAPTVGYAATNGRYTRIGNRVIVTTRIQLNSYSAGSGDVQYSSLPITSNNTSNNVHVAPIILNSVTFGLLVAYYCASLQPNSTSADIVGTISASSSLNLAASGAGASSIFGFTMAYEV